jgi:hypothetical protein
LKTREYAYLAGDSYHDERLLTGEKEFATWVDAKQAVCCIHSDKETAEKTLKLIRAAQQGHSSLGKIEVVSAHDSSWAKLAREYGRFFPGRL